jgi:hypothetical protein
MPFIYVTEKFLQARYPTRGTIANASNVEIESPSSHVLEKRLQRIDGHHSPHLRPDRAITATPSRASMSPLAALTHSIDHLPPFQFRVLGHGPAQNESLARYDAPLNDKDAVLEWLNNIDVYLQTLTS